MTTNPIGEKCCEECNSWVPQLGGAVEMCMDSHCPCHTKTEVQKQIEAIGTVGAETAQKMQTEDMGGRERGTVRVYSQKEVDALLESARSEAKREVLKQVEAEMLDKIYYIGNELPQVKADVRDKFVLLGYPSKFLEDVSKRLNQAASKEDIK